MKPLSLLFSSHHGFPSVCWNHWASNTSSFSISSARHQTSSSSSSSPCRGSLHRPWEQKRTYANVVDGGGDELHWPQSDKKGTVPTPYQIFNLSTDAPYSKRRFFELVKIYHPDRATRCHESSEVMGLSHTVRLERYRLIIAANEILADPVRRHAYDRYGTGWDGHVKGSSSEARKGKYAYYREWEGGWTEPSPRYNATWEDWEQWHHRGSRRSKPQQPVLVENNTFVSIIIVIAAIGGTLETIRARNLSVAVHDRTSRLHDATSRDLKMRQKELGLDDAGKDNRIETFLRLRDPVGCGVTDPMEERIRRLLPEPEICSSEDIKSRSMEAYRRDDGAGR